MSVGIGSRVIGSVTGLLGFAIGISPTALPLPLPSPPEVVPGFAHAARIAAMLGMAIAAPPARRRKSRRFIG